MRRFVVAFAVIGVLLHAFALVRHAGIQTSRAFAAASNEVQRLQADLGVICHAPAGDETPASQPAGGSLPSNEGSSCPVCSKLCAAVAFPGPTPLTVFLPLLPLQKLQLALDVRVEKLKQIRPQGRGPPAYA